MGMKILTMVTVNGKLENGKDRKSISGYTFISDDYQMVTMTTDEVKMVIGNKSAAITNLGIENGKVVGTNGSLDKYTFVDVATGLTHGAKYVILNRVEKDDKLVGYTVFSNTGKLLELSVHDAAALANQKLISNGKIRSTQTGDIVSAIGGNYPLRLLKVEKAPDGEITVELSHFGWIVGSDKRYFSAVIKCTSAAQLSKLDKELCTSNAEVVASAANIASQSIRGKLGMVRIGAADIAGSFNIGTLSKLLKYKNTKVVMLMDTVTVSVYKYEGTTVIDSDIIFDQNWKVAKKNESNNGEVDKAAISFASEIANEFNHVKLIKKK